MKAFRLIAAVALLTASLGASAQFANSSSKSSSRSGSSGLIVNDCKGYNRFSIGYSGMKLKDDNNDGFVCDAFPYDEDKADNYKLKGIQAEYLRGISLSKKIPLFLEIGGNISYNTAKESCSDSDEGYIPGYGYDEYTDSEEDRYNFLSLAVPFNLTYKLTLKPGLYIAPYAGFHFRVNLLATDKWKESRSYDTYTKYNKDEDETYNLFKSDDDDDDAAFDEDDRHLNRFQFGGQAGVNIGYKALNIGLGYVWDSPIYKYNKDYSYDKDGNGKYKVKTGYFTATLGVNF